MTTKAILHWLLLSNTSGIHWLRDDKRLSLFLRDGCACGYCNSSVSDLKSKSPHVKPANRGKPETFTVDHLKPRSKGGTHHETNLVLSCKSCNDERKDMDWKKFATITAKLRGVNPEAIISHIQTTSQRPLDRDLAKKLMARRGSAAKVVASGDAAKAVAAGKATASPGGNPTDQRRTVSGRRGPGSKGGWRSGARAKGK